MCGMNFICQYDLRICVCLFHRVPERFFCALRGVFSNTPNVKWNYARISIDLWQTEYVSIYFWLLWLSLAHSLVPSNLYARMGKNPKRNGHKNLYFVPVAVFPFKIRLEKAIWAFCGTHMSTTNYFEAMWHIPVAKTRMYVFRLCCCCCYTLYIYHIPITQKTKTENIATYCFISTDGLRERENQPNAHQKSSE